MSSAKWLFTRQHTLFATFAPITFVSVVLNARSEAEIVYTAVDVTMGGSGYMEVDLDHNGIKDFDIQAAGTEVSCGSTSGGVHVVITTTPTTGNGVVANVGNAAALASGVRVGPALTFYDSQTLMTNSLLTRGCNSYRYGEWCSRYSYSCGKSAYLGLKFMVNGQTYLMDGHMSWSAPPSLTEEV